MHVIVLGAGVIGVTTAWHLREAGCDVTVIERESDVAQATSLGNAGVIAPGYVTPWAAPGMPGKILKYLFKPASPLISGRRSTPRSGAGSRAGCANANSSGSA